MGDLLRFPGVPRDGARWSTIFFSRLRRLVGRALLRLGVPGAIRDCELYDRITGCRVRIRVSVLAVRVTVGQRDFYFDRFTGEPDGAGTACP
jgi:hypothetical protein